MSPVAACRGWNATPVEVPMSGFHEVATGKEDAGLGVTILR